MTTETKKQIVWDYLKIIMLAVLVAFNYKLFVEKIDFAPAGINGVAKMIQDKTGFFNIGYTSLIINVPLCLACFFLVDKRYALRTATFVVVYSVLYAILKETTFLNKYQFVAEGAETLFPTLIAGIISGFVYGALFKINSSTGGTDLIAKYMSYKKPTLNFFWITFVLNAVVAITSYFVYGNHYLPVCLCILYCFMSSYMGNRMLQGVKLAYKFIIITTHAEEIDAEIIRVLKHSATKLVGTGAYSHNEKDVIICVVNKHQLVEFQNILKKYDDTFAVVETVNDTVGNFLQVKKSSDIKIGVKNDHTSR